MKKQPGAYFHIGYPPMYFGYNLLEMAFPRFTGFYTVHGPSPLKKETYRFFWEKEEELLDGVCSHPFRHKDDVSQYVLREYQKLSGDFVRKGIVQFPFYMFIWDFKIAVIDADALCSLLCDCLGGNLSASILALRYRNVLVF